jgi:hypothetical protein
MRISLVGVRDPIAWAVRREDPVQIPLDNPPGWSLLHPSAAVGDVFMEPYGTSYVPQLEDGRWLLTNHQLAFILPEAVSSEELGKVAESLLRRLRHVTKQVTLTLDLVMTVSREVDALPQLEFPGETGYCPDRIRDHFIDTPVTVEAVQQAGGLSIDFNAPTYEILLMDAFAALLREDYRTAILYAAIAVETLAGALCEEEHERLFKANPRSDTIRAISTISAGGLAEEVDPIYRHLRHSRSFRVLISELPLYVFRRSILHENHGLYQRALRLYCTRNNLAHQGQLAAGADVFPITHAGAIQALECAVEVFGWFGSPGRYLIPRGAWHQM